MRPLSSIPINPNNSSRLYRPITIILCLLLMLMTLAPIAHGQSAEQYWAVNPAFQSGNGSAAEVSAVAVQPDGKILVGGAFLTYDNIERRGITRLNADGSVDPSFNAAGTGASDIIWTIVVQPDGKILIGGAFIYYNDVLQRYISRLNPDGSLDSTFNPGGFGPNYYVQSIVLQNDGKILIGGSFDSYNNTPAMRMARLNVDGSLDTSFNPSPGSYVQALAIQPDGKILASGVINDQTGHPYLVRLNQNGSPDTSFNAGGAGPNERARTIVIQNDGKILIGGDFTSYNGVSRSYVARLNADGSLDAGFDPGSKTTGGVSSIILQAGGKVVLAGSFGQYNGQYHKGLARANPDGSADETFNPGGSGFDDIVDEIAAQSDGKILVVGKFNRYNDSATNRITRLSQDGNLDPAFQNKNSGANLPVLSVVVQPDGKILIGGAFDKYNGVARPHIARLNADGSLDTSFNPGIGASQNIYTIVLQPDGKILIGGDFAYYNEVARSKLARLNPDGSLDESFNPGTGANKPVRTIAVQPDGKIVAGGDFTLFNNTARDKIVRLNTDGSLDAGFNAPTLNLFSVYTIVLQSGNRILVGGNTRDKFTVTGQALLRLSGDGSLDSNFVAAPEVTYGIVEAMAIQSNGKILLGGTFTNPKNNIMRLNENGSYDSSFNPGGSGATAYVHNIITHPDGRILIAGGFSSYNNIPRQYLAWLNPDGTLNNDSFPAFPLRTSSAVIVNSIALQATDKLLVGGNFWSIDTYTRPYLVQFQAQPKTASSVTVTSSSNPGTVGQNVTFTATVTPANATGQVEFTIGSTVVSSPLVNGVATYTATPAQLQPGVIAVKAKYPGVAAIAGSTSPTYNQTINKATAGVNVSGSATSVGYNQPVIFTATVTGLTPNVSSPTGEVTFNFGGENNVTTTLFNGVASYLTNTLPAGSYAVTASYNGNAIYNSAASGPANLSVAKAPATIHLTSANNPAVAGQAITFTALVGPLPGSAGGTASFNFNFADGSSYSTNPLAVTNGIASYVTTTQQTGSYSVTVSYSGDANHNPTTSANYVQYVVAGCDPLLVTSATDDGQATTCGTFSYALANATGGRISFALPDGGITVSLSGPLTPALKPDVAIDGGANGITLDANGASGAGLRLSGNNRLNNLTIRGFSMRGLIIAGSANQLYHIKVLK